MSESTVGDTFETLFRHAQNRIIVASFASNIHRVQQIVNAAYDNNRKVAFIGRSMVNVVGVASELGYLTIPKDSRIEIEDLNRYPDNEVCVVTTGSQGETMAALSRMASGEHRQMEIQHGDLVIFSSSPIPGNEKGIKKVINGLFERGADVIYESLADVHVSGHACQEELKLFHALVKPKYFIPAHGEFSHLRSHALLAERMGMSTENIFVMDIGDVMEFTEEGAKPGKKVPSGMTMIDGLGVGDVGNIVLRDRKMLAEEGLIVVVVALSKETRQLVSGPDVISRGFVYVRESEELMNKTRDIVRGSLDKCQKKNATEWSSYKNVIKDDLNNFFYQTMKRSPVILPIIMEV
jgi:ribonuclease J